MAGFCYLWYNIFMENMPSHRETEQSRVGRISRFFGKRAVRHVLENGASEVTLLPVLGGFYPNDNDAIIGYTQRELDKEGISTHIEQDMIESGSDAKIPRYRLFVDSRPET